MPSLDDMRSAIADFATARDWDQFHTPKNLAMALGGETGELLAELQWTDGNDLTDPALCERIASEIADIAIYLIRFADVVGLDLLECVQAKLRLNAERYPVDKARGTAEKYSRLDKGE